MKKFLVIVLAFVIVSFAGIANVFATGVGNQSIDITVGEVDETNSINDKKQKVHTPKTGFLGLDADSASVTLTICSTIFVIAIFALLSMCAYHKHKKKADRRIK